MPSPRTASATRRDLTLLVLDVLAWSVMVGLGETHLTAFALALGVGESVAGLVATLPLLLGSVLQHLTLRGARVAGSLRRWVVACVVVQALCYLPLVVGGFRRHLSTPAFFLVAGLYWAAALASGPAWNTWVEDLVPARLRATFFARRALVSQVVLGLTLLASGGVLQRAAAEGWRLEAFGALFLVACLARLISAHMLSRQQDAALQPADEVRVPLAALLHPARRSDDGRLVAYLLVNAAAVHLSAPFFAPFLLAELKVGYMTWVAVLAAPYLARILTLPLWGRLARRRGPLLLVWIGALGIVPLPYMWTLSRDVRVLLLVALWSGLTWAAHEQGSFLLFFETMRAAERTSVLPTHNLARAFFMVGGSLLGAALLRSGGEGYAAYASLFGLASAARLVAVALLWRLGRGEKVVAARRRRATPVRGLAPREGVPLTAGRAAPR